MIGFCEELPYEAPKDADLVIDTSLNGTSIDDSVQKAYDFINSWPKWLKRMINIYGPPGSGKTHLTSFLKKKTSVKTVPFNHQSGHIQFFTLKKFKGIVFKNNLLIKFIKNGSIFGADLTGSTILKPNIFKELNTFLADYIPNFMSATWIFKLQKDE